MHNQFKLGFLTHFFKIHLFTEKEATEFVKLSKEEKEIIPLDIYYFIKKQSPHLLEQEIVEELKETPKYNSESFSIGWILRVFTESEMVAEPQAEKYLECIKILNVKGDSYLLEFIERNYPHLLEENTSNTIIRQPFSIEYIENNFNTYKAVTENEATMYLKDLKKYNQEGNEAILFFIKCNFPRL